MVPASPLPLSDPEPISKAPAERRKGEYALPPAALLDAPKAERKIDERELMDGARLLEEKCREFSVEGSVVQIHPGPVVTTYELKPDAGVNISKVTGLSDDLCLAMQAESVLIDRIPGKSTVGIQIPNRTREPISLRELLESEAYRRTTSKLTIALGKTIHGEPFMADLAAMPHLLIAGVDRRRQVGRHQRHADQHPLPRHARRCPDDHDRSEASGARDVRRHPAPDDAGRRRSEAGGECAPLGGPRDGRALQDAGGRRRAQHRAVQPQMFSRAIAEKRTPKDGEAPRPLPFIVVVIDELADLMMVASNEVEESIARLAQMARAVGIHLILATQRPSVDVITGLIKANLPARIAFRVASKIDSRTILDANGAEQLPRPGRHAVLAARFVSRHSPAWSVHFRAGSARLASFLRKQGKPTYDETITAEEKTATDGIEMDKDDLYDEAARIVVQSSQASISVLAAAIAYRIQPRCAPRGHDGDGRPGVACGPEASLVRCSSTRTTSPRSTRNSDEHEYGENTRSFRSRWSSRRRPCSPRRRSGRCTTEALARERTVRIALAADDTAPIVLGGRARDHQRV